MFRLLATLEAAVWSSRTANGRNRLAYGVVQLTAGATKMDDLSRLSRSPAGDTPQTDRRPLAGFAALVAAPVFDRLYTLRRSTQSPARPGASATSPSPAAARS